MKCKARLRVCVATVQLQSDYRDQSDEFDQWLTSATDKFALYSTQDSDEVDETEVGGDCHS